MVVTFWANLKTLFLSKNCCDFFRGNFWKNLGIFLFLKSSHTGLTEHDREGMCAFER